MVVVPIKDVVYTDFQGTGGILVDLKTKQYYQLNETGSLIWRGLEKGDTVDDIAVEMSMLYEVTAEHAKRSVETLLSNLEMRRLVSRS
jgi:coenzyme PQQ synthesis protein D (PqqD)